MLGVGALKLLGKASLGGPLQRIATGAVAGAIAGAVTEDNFTRRGAAEPLVGGAMAGALLGLGTTAFGLKAVGRMAWGLGKNMPGMGWAAAKGTAKGLNSVLGFTLNHPRLALGGAALAGAALYMGRKKPYEPTKNVNMYGVPEGIPRPMPNRREFMDSTEGLVQGMHGRRHR